MKSKIRYQLLDGAPNSAGKMKIFYYFILCIIVVLVIWMVFGDSRDINDYDIFKQQTITPNRYEQIIEDMKKELKNKNDIISGLQQDYEKMNTTSKMPIKFRKRPETEHVQCGRLLTNDKEYMKQVGGKSNRIPIVETKDLNISCPSILSRVNPQSDELSPLKFGVAFARNVFKDYEFLEDQVRASFHPQNVFCFAIDKKADEKFHSQIRALASCLPNVLLLPEDKSVDSAGHNTNIAHYNCMKALINKPGWEYVLLLQNHDIVTKTVYELVKIYDLLAGANDAEISSESGRLDKSKKWDPKSLKLFKNETGIKPEILNRTMKFAKGAPQGSLSRAAVHWMTQTADLTIYLDQWNAGGFGVDEQFIESFQVSDFLEMPGHFTDECLKQGKRTDFISRMSQWHGKCGSETVRHAICLLGVEDFPIVAAFPNIMFNKMIPSFDSAIIDCTGELIFNRTFLKQNDHPLETSYYENMVNVIYHKHHNDPGFKLNCTPSYVLWSDRKYPA